MVLQMFIISFIAFQIIKFIKPIPPNDQQERKQLIWISVAVSNNFFTFIFPLCNYERK